MTMERLLFTPLKRLVRYEIFSISQISLECTRHRKVPRPRTLSSPSIPFAIAGDKFRAWSGKLGDGPWLEWHRHCSLRL